MNIFTDNMAVLMICIVVCMSLSVMITYLLMTNDIVSDRASKKSRLYKIFCLLSCVLINAIVINYTLQPSSVDDLIGIRNIHQILRCLIIQFLVSVFFGCVYRIIVLGITNRDYHRIKIDRRSMLLFLLFGSLYCICVMPVIEYKLTGIERIVINEVSANNVSVELDFWSTVCDYIELYNKSDAKCYTDRLYLSDDLDMLKKKVIEPTTIQGNGYLLIGLEHEELSIRKEGNETIYLSDDLGRILDQVTTVGMEADYSFARCVDGGDEWIIQSCTPNMPNQNGTKGSMEEKRIAEINPIMETPVFSHQSGFYDESFDLTISVNDEYDIYYTLDGSIPTRNSNLYSAPIRIYDRSKEPNVFRNIKNVEYDWMDKNRRDVPPVDKAFIVRAVAIDDDDKRSEESFATYFVDKNNYCKNSVVSLIVDPEALWNEKDGIYVTGSEFDAWYAGDRSTSAPMINFRETGRKSEVEGILDYISEELSFGQYIGIRVSGASSRMLPLKRFALFSRKEYSGDYAFDEDIFEGINSHKFVLREGCMNAICQKIVHDREVATQGYKLVSVFLNGEFWYNTALMERYDSLYFAEHYGVYKDNVVIFKHGIMEEGYGDARFLTDEIYSYLENHDLSRELDYEGFAEIIDIKSYIDYMCINAYIDNMDFNENKNNVWWRTKNKTSNLYEDGRWRFCLYDLDAGDTNDYAYYEGCQSKAQKNSFSLTPRTQKVALNMQSIFAALNRNEHFRRQFVLTFMDLVNEHFRFEKVYPVLNEYIEATSSDFSYLIDFFRDRPKWITGYLAEEYKLSGSLESLRITIDNDEAGYIQLNSIMPSFSNGVWCGQYYTDYPVSITAIPKEGYEFAGWSGEIDSPDASQEVYLRRGGVELHAAFKSIQ